MPDSASRSCARSSDAHVDLAEPGLLVDLGGARDAPVRAAWRRAGATVTRTRLGGGAARLRHGSAPSPAGRRAPSRSRSSRVCRRLTASSVVADHAPCTGPPSMRTSLDVRQRDQQRAVDAHEARLGPLAPRGWRAGRARRWRAVAGVQAGVVAVRLDVEDLGALARTGSRRRARPRSSRPRPLRAAGCRRRARLDHPAYGLGEPLLAHRLEHVVDGVAARRRRRRARRAP